MSLPDPAMNLLNAEYNALLTPQARTRFLSSYTGMAADRVERIDQSGSPWPGTLERETREAEALGIELSRYLAGLAKAVHGDGSEIHEQSEVSEVEAEPLAVVANDVKIACDFVVIATHVPLAGKSGAPGAESGIDDRGHVVPRSHLALSRTTE